ESRRLFCSRYQGAIGLGALDDLLPDGAPEVGAASLQLDFFSSVCSSWRIRRSSDLASSSTLIFINPVSASKAPLTRRLLSASKSRQLNFSIFTALRTLA